MAVLVATLVLVILIPATLQLQESTVGVSDHPTTLEERDAIITRFERHAGEIYTQHDVAVVLHEREPNDFHHISKRDLRSVTNKDENGMIRNVRLVLASGSEINLQLKKKSLFDPDTQFVDNVGYGRLKRAMRPLDCYAAGNVVKNEKIQGPVSVATCSGLHGKAFSNGMEYYIHPVDHLDGEQHHVHLFSRSAPENKINRDFVDNSIQNLEANTGNVYTKYRRSVGEETGANKRNVTSAVIEMAVVVDSYFWNKIQKLLPNRIDEYILLKLAAVNALYSDLEEFGYYIQIKVKMYEVWIVNPEGYNYQPGVLKNVYSFCTVTRKNYDYDLHYLFTGNPNHGLGWCVGKVCNKRWGCVGAATGSTALIAHEIGHSVGLTHGSYTDCPFKDKSVWNFMNTVYFTKPCIAWELDKFFGKGGGKCLFEETKETKTSEKFTNIPPVFTGQYYNPDDYCKYNNRDDYELFRPYNFRGDAECYSLMCINRNKDSPEYLSIDKIGVPPLGYTCGDDMFCNGANCKSWDATGPPINKYRWEKMKRQNFWSKWSRDWTPCSHTCGTGVQLKRRRCIFSEGPFLSPYCTGSPIQFRPCNEEPCPEEPLSINGRRQAIGNQICQRFHENNVSLSGSDSYLPQSTYLDLTSWYKFTKGLPNKSCFFTCVRNISNRNIIDSIYPDGTPCIGSSYRERLGIKFRCVEGACLEFSGCPGNERKDSCGLCGENPDRCIQRKFNESDDPGFYVPKTLAVLPVGTMGINFHMTWWLNKGARLWVYDTKEKQMLGVGGRIGGWKFEGKFANATWSFQQTMYVKADGPIDRELVVKVIRVHDQGPIHKIFAQYILPKST